jgi:hypothetical protein
LKKKKQKNFCSFGLVVAGLRGLNWACGGEPAQAQSNESFLLLFFKKEALTFFS